MWPSRNGRPGVAGRLCRGVPREDRRNAGVREVDAISLVGENSPGSEKRTLFDLREDGVLVWKALSDLARVFTGEIASLPLFGFRRAMGTSRSDCVVDAMILGKSRVVRVPKDVFIDMVMLPVLLTQPSTDAFDLPQGDVQFLNEELGNQYRREKAIRFLKRLVYVEWPDRRPLRARTTDDNVCCALTQTRNPTSTARSNGAFVKWQRAKVDWTSGIPFEQASPQLVFFSCPLASVPLFVAGGCEVMPIYLSIVVLETFSDTRL